MSWRDVAAQVVPRSSHDRIGEVAGSVDADEDELTKIAKVELEASRRDPYRHLSRVFHLVGCDLMQLPNAMRTRPDAVPGFGHSVRCI